MFSLNSAAALSAQLQAQRSYYYAIENLDTGAVVRRDTTTVQGIPQNGLILAPNTNYREWLLNADTGAIGFTDFATPSSGLRFTIPQISFQLPLTPDSDGDGLSDDAEFILGTDPAKADTDGDGIRDGAEVAQGTDPLDGLPARTGIIATADTAGTAVDVCARDDIVAIADSDRGVSVFNVFNGMKPVIIAQVGTPGNAQAVACEGNLIAVADGSEGLAVVDISDPPAARIVQQIALADSARAVATAGDVAYVAAGDAITEVDLQSGAVIDQRHYSGGSIDDVSIAGDFLYALAVSSVAPHTVHKIQVADHLDVPTSSLTVQDHPTFGRMHIFSGGGLVYVGASDDNFSNQVPGIEVISDSDAGLALIGPPSAITAFDVAVNGSGLAVFTGADAGLEATAKVGLLDVRDPTRTDRFLSAFDTPGAAAAVSIFNGLAYIADRTAGMQVINYLSNDALGVPPTITLSTSFGPDTAEEGKLVRVTANVSDDVQVRNVEFYVDGVKAATDGNFPFEYRFVTPRLKDQASFRLRARASDTGGNATWTDETVVRLLPDTTPPRVMRVTPISGDKIVDTVSAYWSEPIDPATLTTVTFQVFATGPDGLAGTGDDVLVPGGAVSFHDDTLASTLQFGTPLPDGLYRAVVSGSVTDRAGNPLGADFAWHFWVADGVFWIGTASGAWEDSGNWASGRVPGTPDNVYIDAPQGVTITHSQGTTSINSLHTTSPFILSGGTLDVSGVLELGNTLTLSGGTLTGATVAARSAEGRVVLTPLGGTLEGVTLDADLYGTEGLCASATVRNGLTLNGRATLGEVGMLLTCAELNFVGDQTLAGTGEVVFGASESLSSINSLVAKDAATTLTIGPSITIRGHGGSIRGAGTFVNLGLISADAPGSITLGTNGWSSSGFLEAADGGTLNLGGTFTTAGLRAVQQRDGGTVSLTGTLDNTGQTLDLSVAGSWRLSRGTIIGGSVTGGASGAKLVLSNLGGTLDGITLDADLRGQGFCASATVRNGLTLNGRATLGEIGTLFNCVDLIFVGDQTLAGTGEVLFGGFESLRSINSVVVQDAGTTLTIGPDITVHGHSGSIGGKGALVNQGLISADAPGSIEVGMTGVNNGISGVNNEGVIEATNGARLGMWGLVLNSGDLTPGNTDVVSISDDYMQTAAGALNIDIGGVIAGSGFSQLAVSGLATLDGTLNVSLVGGFDPTLGTSFALVTANSLAGQFATINGLNIGNGKRFDVTYAQTGVTLVVVPQ